ncbi:DUF4038 domain-containing protein [Mumia sp. DW29H23]|uniref:apiosidase-like domain-containing protein n=1 Tax=Mumia sp. DW29H23 TaxID=3421241 RepID=UPI003D694B59
MRLRRPGRWAVVALAAVLVLAVGVYAGLRVWHVYRFEGQAMPVPGEVPTLDSTPATPPSAPQAGSGPFVAGVSDDGRFFVDHGGDPVLVQGDSPWSLLAAMTLPQAEDYWEQRAGEGVNAAIVSLVGARTNGGSESGATVDGIVPFLGGLPFSPGSVTRPNPAYFDRAHDVVAAAAEQGITVFLYAVDGWTIGHAFSPDSVGQCAAFGRYVGRTFADLPNVVWAVGGDYAQQDPPSDVDRCFDAVRVGLASSGDDRPFSIQFTSPLTTSRDSPYWRTRVGWSFVYSYVPTYAGVLAAYAQTPPIPAVLGESNYEGMNLQPDTPPTTEESLRRQVLWALTSGAAGDFYGSADWEFLPGWEDRLDRPGLRQVAVARAAIASLRWWELVPDTQDAFVTSGRGTPFTPDQPPVDVLDDDYATAARTSDGREAVVYVPTSRTITLDLARLSGRPVAAWVDPTDGSRHPVPLTPSLTTPGPNAGGDEDWLLVVEQAAG